MWVMMHDLDRVRARSVGYDAEMVQRHRVLAGTLDMDGIMVRPPKCERVEVWAFGMDRDRWYRAGIL